MRAPLLLERKRFSSNRSRLSTKRKWHPDIRACCQSHTVWSRILDGTVDVGTRSCGIKARAGTAPDGTAPEFRSYSCSLLRCQLGTITALLATALRHVTIWRKQFGLDHPTRCFGEPAEREKLRPHLSAEPAEGSDRRLPGSRQPVSPAGRRRFVIPGQPLGRLRQHFLGVALQVLAAQSRQVWIKLMNRSPSRAPF